MSDTPDEPVRGEVARHAVPRKTKVKIALDGQGLGTVFLNGIEVGRYVRSTSVRSTVGDATIVTLQIMADEVELESSEATVMLDEYRIVPEDPPPLEHQFASKGEQGAPSPFDICTECRQVRRVAAPVCPGKMMGSVR